MKRGTEAATCGSKKMTREDVERLLEEHIDVVTVSDRFSVAIDRLSRHEQRQNIEKKKDRQRSGDQIPMSVP